MTRLRYKLEETSGRRMETWFEVTGAEAALATIGVGGRQGIPCVVQRGRQGNLYWPKPPGGSIIVGKAGFNSIMDQARPAGTGLPRRLIPFFAQSDGAGRGLLVEAPADLSSAARAYLFDHSHDYAVSVEPASATSGTVNTALSDSAPTYSPVTRMLQRMALNDPTHEYVGIPCCVGATSSVDWGVKTGVVTELYGASVFRIRAAQLLLGGTIPFVVVGQCTTNGGSSALAASWDEDWDTILDTMEVDLAGLFEGASLRAIFTKVQAVKPSGLAYAGADWTTLQGSADNLVSANRKQVQLPGSIGPDNIHENTAGLVVWADDIGNTANSNGWLSAA